MSKEIKRTIKVGTFIFPAEWVELNPERAKECEYVAFLVEDGKCAVYYSNREAYGLDEEEEHDLRELGKKVGFSKEANIFGFVEKFENVGNARIEKEWFYD